MGTNDPLFARSAVPTGLDGKCEDRIDIPASTELKEKLIALSVLADKPRATYARMLLIKAIEGELAYLRSIGQIPAAGDGSNRGST
jgi:hypothetical protein